MKNLLLALLNIGILTSNSFANAGGIDRMVFDRKPVKSQPQMVRWIGEVKDEASDHTLGHGHALEFIKKDDGKKYDIVDSPELIKLHHETEGNYVVEIEAEKTPRFLFWGGNLVVKNFRVLEKTASVPHLVVAKPPVTMREFPGKR